MVSSEGFCDLPLARVSRYPKGIVITVKYGLLGREEIGATCCRATQTEKGKEVKITASNPLEVRCSIQLSYRGMCCKLIILNDLLCFWAGLFWSDLDSAEACDPD